MDGRGSAILVIVICALVALVGLFMAARAEDLMFAFHGWVFVVFGILMVFGVAGRMGAGK